MKTFISILMLGLIAFSGNAQQVTASAGGYAETGNLNVSWTLGECITETLGNNDFSLCQGFQQNWAVVTAIPSWKTPFLNVYPNPTEQWIFIEGCKDKSVVRMYDLSGNLIFENTYEQSLIELSLYDLGSGVYILRVDQNDGKIENFRIVKN